ncbi:MAG: DUF892 family protein [Cyclobacteriaceae bacterium]
MKRNIKTLADALAYQLEGLVFVENRIKKEYTTCNPQIASNEVRSEIKKYMESSEEKLLKLKRVFNYLLREPVASKNKVINEMLAETHHLLDYATTSELKDILMISCIQKINAYKVAAYRIAYRFAVELELETAGELLYEVIQWELQANTVLAELSTKEFNRASSAINPS